MSDNPQKLYVAARFAFWEETIEWWEENNPVLEDGEPSFVRNPRVEGEWFKTGDGVTPWVDLPWKKGPEGKRGEKGEPGGSAVGRPTDGGGEIFNDYDTNRVLTKFGTAHGADNLVGICGYPIKDITIEDETHAKIVVDDSAYPLENKALAQYANGDILNIDADYRSYLDYKVTRVFGDYIPMDGAEDLAYQMLDPNSWTNPTWGGFGDGYVDRSGNATHLCTVTLKPYTTYRFCMTMNASAGQSVSLYPNADGFCIIPASYTGNDFNNRRLNIEQSKITTISTTGFDAQFTFTTTDETSYVFRFNGNSTWHYYRLSNLSLLPGNTALSQTSICIEKMTFTIYNLQMRHILMDGVTATDTALGVGDRAHKVSMKFTPTEDGDHTIVLKMAKGWNNTNCNWSGVTLSDLMLTKADGINLAEHYTHADRDVYWSDNAGAWDGDTNLDTYNRTVNGGLTWSFGLQDTSTTDPAYIYIKASGLETNVEYEFSYIYAMDYQILFDSIRRPNPRNNWVWVVEKPLAGVPSGASQSGHATGERNVVAGDYAVSNGCDNISCGRLSYTNGRDNIAGYCAQANGRGNQSIADYCTTDGVNNENRGYAAHVSGGNCLATVNASYAFLHGHGLIADSPLMAVFGAFNDPTGHPLFSVGNGTNDTDRSNLIAVYEDGSMSIGGVTVTPAQLTALLALLG